MDRENYGVIAFPVLGTGQLQFPKEEVADTMLDVMMEYQNLHPNTCIKEIKIVVFPQKGDNTQQVQYFISV